MSTTIESLELEIKQNSQSAVDGINALTQSLTNLRNATKGGLGLKSVTNSLSDINGKLNPAITQMKKFSNIIKNIQSINKKSASSFLVFGSKIGMAIFSIKKLADGIGKVIEKSSNYIEDLNLFTVAMGKYADEASAYAQQVSELMGIDPGEWMRNQGLFQTLITGFGVAGEGASKMSKNLTQLAYDLSSFYNIDVEKAMQKLKSGMAGELEPLRAIGYDLSQAKLEATAKELGIDKVVSEMTQAEKSMLRYHAIMSQVTVTHGDMARTLDQPANQIRILKAQLEMLGRELGNVFMPLLQAILPVGIAVVKVLREVISAIAMFVGFKTPEIEVPETDGMVSGSEATEEALSGASEQAKKLKSYMLGFDELNVISPNTESEDTLSSDVFDIPILEYDFISESVSSKVNEIVDKMKEWLGITGDIDSWADLFNTRLGKILETVGLIGLGITGWKITNSALSFINSLGDPAKAAALKTTSGILMTIIGAAITITNIIDAWKNGLDWENLIGMIGGVALVVGGLALVFGTTGAAIGLIVGGLALFVTGIKDALDGSKSLETALSVVIGILAVGVGIAILVGGWIPLVIAAVTSVIALVVMYWDEIVTWCSNAIKTIGQFFVDLWDGIVDIWKKVDTWFDTNVIQPVVNFFKGLWKSISGFFDSLWEDIKDVWNKVSKWFDEKVVQPIVNFFAPIVEWISDFFEGCWIIVQAVWLIASTWFNDNVVTPIVDFFKGLWESVSEFFTSLWNDIVEIWNTVSTWFNENVIIPVVDFFKGLWESIAGYFTSLWEDITKVWSLVSKWFDDNVTQPVVGFFKGVWISVSGFFTSLWEDVKGVWEKVSKWFEDNIIDPVKTAFDKACEAISGFFSSLWLGIRQGVAKAMNGVIEGIESAINWVVRGINSLIGGFDKVVQWAADVIGADWGGISLVQEVKFDRITVPTFAQGGFPESGQTFIARENGIPEMVGTIGRRTAVANNEQIVESVASGVAEANSEQNMLLREQNSILRALLEKDSGVYLDGRSLSKSVDKFKNEQGRVILGGAL